MNRNIKRTDNYLKKKNEIICNILNAHIDQFNASLLNKIINFFQKQPPY